MIVRCRVSAPHIDMASGVPSSAMCHSALAAIQAASGLSSSARAAVPQNQVIAAADALIQQPWPAAQRPNSMARTARAFRLAGAIAAFAVTAVGAAGCASAGHGTSVSRLGTVKMARFTGNGLSFQYPAAWRARWWNDVSSFSALITYLSPSQLQNPCTRSTTATAVSVSCGYPIQRLPAGGILVTWTADGFPTGPGITKVNSTIGGHPAMVTKGVPGSCADIGGDETITAKIMRAAADNWYTMTACMHAPGLRQDELAVRAMLKSVRISELDRTTAPPVPRLT